MRTWLAILSLVLAVPASASAYHLADSLRGSTSGTASGGSFGADGWTVTAPTDRIWWPVPTSSAGSIDFTMSNVTNASLFPGDNDVFNLYDAADSSEPIPYRPDFVEDNYKVWVRIRNEPGYYGNQKLTVAVCPDSALAHSPTCACGPGFVEEATSGDPTWDGTPQHLRIEWGGGQVRFLRNGSVVNTIDYAATGYAWGPRQMHFSIGSTRALAVGTSGMPVGAVFSDLVVDTTDGPVASCPTPPPPMDAGLPDGGACGGAVMAIADGTAASWLPGAFPDSSDLNVEADAANTPTAIVYVRFPAATGSHAILRVHTAAFGSASGGSGHVCRVDDVAWDEGTLAWSSRPTVSTTCTAGDHPVGSNAEVEWDVSALFTSGAPTSFAIVTNDPDAVHYESREVGGCALGPRLFVDGTAPVDAASAIDAASTVDVGTGHDAASGLDASIDAASRGDGSTSRGLSSGCGCRADGARSTRFPWLALAAIVFAVGRRRSRT
jgi:MYXO-CTERM domain-containing protein